MHLNTLRLEGKMLDENFFDLFEQQAGHIVSAARVLEELTRREVIDTAVIASPDARFYPVSLDRFIREILDQEFRE